MNFTYQVTVVIILSCLYNDTVDARKCKFNKHCTCHPPFVDCKSKHLKTIPHLPNTTLVADLSYNFISYIPPYHFRNNSKLLELKIQKNRLQNLEKDSFYGLSNIRELYLQDNRIGPIPGDTFAFLTRLRYLDLKNNHIRTIDLNFTTLTSLKILRMDLIVNESESLPRGLEQVRNVDVSGITGYCNITVLTPNIFRNLPNLEEINISACKINRVWNGTFRHLTNLRILDISYNVCLKFSGAEIISYDLPFTKIQIVKLNKIHKTFEMNTKLKVSHVKSLQFTNITEVHIASNRIQQIETTALQMLPSTIRKIEMSDNEFSYGKYILEGLALPLEYLNISDLFKSHMLNEKDETCEHASTVNSLKEIDKNTDAPDLKVFNSVGIIVVPYRLKTVLYKNCKLRYEIPPFNLTKNTAEYLDGSENIFFSWQGPWLTLYNVWYLDLSSNLCSNVSTVFFKSTPNLRVLRVQNNLLGFVLPYDINGEIMKHVPKLEEINLSENRIPSLPFQFFHAQLALQQLYLGGNMLDGVSFQIVHMRNLSRLDLSNNRFSSLDQTVRSQLDTVYLNNAHFSLDLHGNPLKCTCDTLEFIRWIAHTPINLTGMHTYTCKLADGTKHTLENPKRVHEFLKKKCSSYTSLIIAIIAFIVLFLSILTAGLSYRHRWKLRYMYYMVKIKYQKNGIKQRDSKDKTYKYDAFISYEEANQDFVHKTLLEKLEKDGGLRLCIHKRDFLPGNAIAENITSAIHNSRKIVVIMSQNYLESYWCMFEYNMARVESIYSRNKENILYLVFLQEISTKHLPLIVLESVQSQSYIEYPDDEYGDTVFWDKLMNVLE